MQEVEGMGEKGGPDAGRKEDRSNAGRTEYESSPLDSTGLTGI